jgi:hypothetical protein
MKKINIFISIVMFLFSGCQHESVRKELKEFPIDKTSQLPVSENMVFDPQISADSNGSLLIYCSSSNRFRLFETGDLDIEDAKIIYSADIKTELSEGSALLEMWCSFGSEGEYFSRGINAKVSGFSGWQRPEIYFFLKKGENPVNIKLNILIEGKGKVWIDNIKLEV